MMLAALLAASLAVPRGTLVENVACASNPSQTYTLYLPAKYTTETTWPVLLVLDPRGRGTKAAEIFRDAAEERGWILLSSNNTRSDTDTNVNDVAIRALWPEMSRYSIDPKQIYAAGFSGTATAAFFLAKNTGRLAGIITSGEPWIPELDAAHSKTAVWASTGDVDFNNLDVRRIDGELAQSGTPHHLEMFPGPHSWMPAALARDAVEWHTLLAMRDGRRSVDSAFADRLYTNQMERASSERELPALRRYEGIVRDFAGVHDTTEAARRATALRSSAALKQQQREQEKADAYERGGVRKLIGALSSLLAGDPEPVAVAVTQLGIRSLQHDAAGDDARAFAARRILEQLFVQCAFYLPQKYFGTHEYEKAVTVLGIAAAVKPDRAAVEYDLACANALAGHEKSALDALERAVELGFKDAAHARSDADLAAVRKSPRFEQILSRIGS